MFLCISTPFIHSLTPLPHLTYIIIYTTYQSSVYNTTHNNVFDVFIHLTPFLKKNYNEDICIHTINCANEFIYHVYYYVLSYYNHSWNHIQKMKSEFKNILNIEIIQTENERQLTSLSV